MSPKITFCYRISYIKGSTIHFSNPYFILFCVSITKIKKKISVLKSRKNNNK